MCCLILVSMIRKSSEKMKRETSKNRYIIEGLSIRKVSVAVSYTPLRIFKAGTGG
jgi:hypothetical protein